MHVMYLSPALEPRLLAKKPTKPAKITPAREPLPTPRNWFLGRIGG